MFRPDFPLTVSGITSAYRAGLAAIESGQESFDLAGVSGVDSSAVAALVGWKRAAFKRGKSLAFANVPTNLQSLIALYGVEELLQRSDLPHH